MKGSAETSCGSNAKTKIVSTKLAVFIKERPLGGFGLLTKIVSKGGVRKLLLQVAKTAENFYLLSCQMLEVNV